MYVCRYVRIYTNKSYLCISFHCLSKYRILCLCTTFNMYVRPSVCLSAHPSHRLFVNICAHTFAKQCKAPIVQFKDTKLQMHLDSTATVKSSVAVLGSGGPSNAIMFPLSIDTIIEVCLSVYVHFHEIYLYVYIDTSLSICTMYINAST